VRGILKHKDLITETQRKWNMKTKVIPVIKRATGIISKSLRHNPSNIPGKHEVKERQKKQPYWAPHTNCGKCKCTSAKHFTGDVTLRVQTVNTEKRQHCIPHKHGLFQV